MLQGLQRASHGKSNQPGRRLRVSDDRRRQSNVKRSQNLSRHGVHDNAAQAPAIAHSTATRNSSFLLVFRLVRAPAGKAKNSKARAPVGGLPHGQPNTVPFATNAFRQLFALSIAPVAQQASFCNLVVVRFTGARYGE